MSTTSSTRASTDALVKDIGTKYKNVVFLVGAGISTAAGIPDFRSEKTGLYSNLQQYNLPYPEAVFDIDFLAKNPRPFFTLAKEMFPTQFQPTKFHEFIKYVADKGALKRVYTQNIDTLERRAGVPPDLIVEAHGSFSGNHCIDCRREMNDIEELIMAGSVPECEECGGIVKPNIVFFGEPLPKRFFELLEDDFNSEIDLVIVAGTSLQVSPFNQLPDMVSKSVVRYLFNLERVGSLGRRKKDVLVLGSLDTFSFEPERAEKDSKEDSKELTDVRGESTEEPKKEVKEAKKVSKEEPDESKGSKQDSKEKQDSKDEPKEQIKGPAEIDRKEDVTNPEPNPIQKPKSDSDPDAELSSVLDKLKI